MPGNINFILNNELISADLNPATVLLDFIRNQKLTGTKEGCKEGDCGACTVLTGEINKDRDEVIYSAVNSCLIPVQNINGKHVVTIEGLNLPGKELNPIQQEFVNEGASQCGFCTPGFIVSLTGYFLNKGSLNSGKVINSLDGNICRCTGHNSIIRAAEKISDKFDFTAHSNGTRFKFLSENKIIPEYFLYIKERLSKLNTSVIKISSDPGNKKYVSGGTDLFVQIPDEMLNYEITFLSDDPSLKGISIYNGECTIGSLTTVTDILESGIMNDLYPGIKNFAGLFGSTPIRNSATLGGNINNASPIGDMTALFLALDSKVVLSDSENKRTVPLKDFYLSYKTTAGKPDEYTESLKFKIPKGNYYINFEKISKRTYLDIASVNTAILIFTGQDTIREIHLSAGGVAPVPLYLKETCKFLKQKKISAENISNALDITQSEISPISDARGSADYKRMLLNGLIKTHFIKLFPEYCSEGGIF
ncbi:MAG TPA: FAD binding domain-containing protein [Ignavibacteria bacterium]|nr:FAD binding domain-containing protein [Ignavibacteria bacterium]HMR38924.1 FAD binding domain-containing protein [Ignavibacteria bacterium]